jgi:hypothetical protein
MVRASMRAYRKKAIAIRIVVIVIANFNPIIESNNLTDFSLNIKGGTILILI